MAEKDNMCGLDTFDVGYAAAKESDRKELEAEMEAHAATIQREAKLSLELEGRDRRIAELTKKSTEAFSLRLNLCKSLGTPMMLVEDSEILRRTEELTKQLFASQEHVKILRYAAAHSEIALRASGLRDDGLALTTLREALAATTPKGGTE